RQTDVIPVANEAVEELEDEPQRNRSEGEQDEFARRGAKPRVAARAKDDAVGEEDEARPADRRVPRPERLHVRQRRRLRHDHDRETDQNLSRFFVHVTRTRYEQPRSVGVPTPLPRRSTLCVLPSPP